MVPLWCDLVTCRSAAPTTRTTAPTIHAVHEIGRVPLNPITQGAAIMQAPMRAVSPSTDIMSGLNSSARARRAVMAPSTTMVVVARVVVVVHNGERAA